jgi:dephospho-CoA kinase
VLTGGIATGKSYVLIRFAAAGVPTLDADHLAHDAQAPGGPAWQAIRDSFGAEMFDERGYLDRPKLGALVFADAQALATLNRLVHPHVRAAITTWFANLAPTTPFGIVAIPLFYEVPRTEVFDQIIVTACDASHQLARVVARGLTEQQARLRIDAQLPTDVKVQRADHVIWTDGSHADTDRRVEDLCHALSRVTSWAELRGPQGT